MQKFKIRQIISPLTVFILENVSVKRSFQMVSEIEKRKSYRDGQAGPDVQGKKDRETLGHC